MAVKDHIKVESTRWEATLFQVKSSQWYRCESANVCCKQWSRITAIAELTHRQVLRHGEGITAMDALQVGKLRRGHLEATQHGALIVAHTGPDTGVGTSEVGAGGIKGTGQTVRMTVLQAVCRVMMTVVQRRAGAGVVKPDEIHPAAVLPVRDELARGGGVFHESQESRHVAFDQR
jgi:hypothetical protein